MVSPANKEKPIQKWATRKAVPRNANLLMAEPQNQRKCTEAKSGPLCLKMCAVFVCARLPTVWFSLVPFAPSRSIYDHLLGSEAANRHNPQELTPPCGQYGLNVSHSRRQPLTCLTSRARTGIIQSERIMKASHFAVAIPRDLI